MERLYQSQDFAELKAKIKRMGEQLDALLNHCQIPECGFCAVTICPHQDDMHFHHDGCPSCAGDFPGVDDGSAPVATMNPDFVDDTKP